MTVTTINMSTLKLVPDAEAVNLISSAGSSAGSTAGSTAGSSACSTRASLHSTCSSSQL